MVSIKKQIRYFLLCFLAPILITGCVIIFYKLSHPSLYASQENQQNDYLQHVKKFYQDFSKGIIVSLNQVNKERQYILYLQQQIQAGKVISKEQNLQLVQLAASYKLYKFNNSQDAFKALLSRVDGLPKNLIVAIAGLESGWGTSGNSTSLHNYFGIQCFKKGCGKKAKYANVYIRRFASNAENTKYFLRLINTSPRFQALRDFREKSRLTGKTVSDLQYIPYFHVYSQLGSEYLKRLTRTYNTLVKNNIARSTS